MRKREEQTLIKALNNKIKIYEDLMQKFQVPRSFDGAMRFFIMREMYASLRNLVPEPDRERLFELMEMWRRRSTK
jgi:hypothetical protein